MFRHQGKKRTAKHNLQIAVVLSFVAGMVNVTGFLFMGKLTTNVTGHFAYFVYDLSVAEFWKGLIYFLYLFAFLLGSFSVFIIPKTKRIANFANPSSLFCVNNSSRSLSLSVSKDNFLFCTIFSKKD